MISRYMSRCSSSAFLRDGIINVHCSQKCTSSSSRPNVKEVESATGRKSSDEEQKVDFGFQKVTSSEKAEKVHKVFEAVASSYDLMNDLMSAGVHRLWKDHFVRMISPIVPGSKILDVAGGTGDIAFRMANIISNTQPNRKINNVVEFISDPITDDPIKQSTILVSDINQAMLDIGKQRAQNMNFDPHILSWLCADAQALPLEDNSHHLYTIAFGIRNVVDIPKALSEAYRILKPGGGFMCLEFSHVANPAVKWAYDNYSFQIIPPMGELVAGDWKSYQYLVESIRKFPTQEQFKAMIEDAGFRCVTYQSLTFGVVAVHSGFKI